MTYPVFTTLEPGDVGTDGTLQAMRHLARTSVLPSWLSVPTTPEHIRDLLDGAVCFVEDPPGVELVRSPALMLHELTRTGCVEGDCDDLAVLAAALGVAAGFPTRFRVVGFTEDGPYGHVWTEIIDPRTGYVTDVDLFRPDDPPLIRREAVVEV